MAAREPRFRRSPHLVAYWQDGELVLHNYIAGTQLRMDPLAAALLDACGDWRSADAIARSGPRADQTAIRRTFAALTRASIIERSDRPPARDRETALAGWADWNPAAGFFHFSTRDIDFDIDAEAAEDSLRREARKNPPPPPTKRYRGARQIPLPKPVTGGEFARVLLGRRTWRRFARRPIPLADLATLLGLTFGVQRWEQAYDGSRIAFKTSPSGGARHPIEAYVLALRVNDLPRGLYHYAAATHRLELLKRGSSARQVAAYIPGQWWYTPAAALVLMTAVFPRVQWRYHIPRVYRSVLIEAGHFCQTFCLVATWLGLGPFCTLMLPDSRIERDVGADGIGESFIYAAGVGARPAGVDAPWPEHHPDSMFRPPERRRRR